MISILKWSTALINYCAPAFAMAASTSRFEAFALQKNALPVGNAWRSALSRQFINMRGSSLSTTPNAMCAAIATRSAQLVPLKSLSMIPKIRPSISMLNQAESGRALFQKAAQSQVLPRKLTRDLRWTWFLYSNPTSLSIREVSNESNFFCTE